MADGTAIEWTDATWNVVNGCTVLSPGCANCYAMGLAATRLKNHPSRAGLARMHNGHAQWTGQVRFNEAVLLDPLKWRRPRRIFVCAHGDLFHDSVPDEWIDQVFAVMALAPQHSFQVLTKRADRMRGYVVGDDLPFLHGRLQRIQDAAYRIAINRRGQRDEAAGMAARQQCIDALKRISDRESAGFANVWLGVSVEDQQRADERIPHLLAAPAAVRWLSCEPLLGPVNLRDVAFDGTTECDALAGEHIFSDLPQGRRIDWVVAGGESGHRARPMHPDWVRSLRDQCAATGVPFLFKQWGEWAPVDPPASQWDCMPAVNGRAGRITMYSNGVSKPRGFFPAGARNTANLDRLGKKEAGRLLDGQLHDGFPA
jgi:protein gp37